MRIRWGSAVRPREAVFVLALLALALQIAIPPGYMVGGGRDGPTRIVICTNHGPVNAATDLGGPKAPAHGKTSPMPCIFAGHAAPANLASPTPAAAVPWVRFAGVALPPARRIFVGRGLAAPPPARAPPASLA